MPDWRSLPILGRFNAPSSRLQVTERVAPEPLRTALDSITEGSIGDHWVPICKDPELLRGRDATDPAAYRKTAQFEADTFRSLGLVPLGDVTAGGERSYLQSFYWEPRFGEDKTPVKSWNVVAMLPGKQQVEPGRARRVLGVVGHLDNLSEAEKLDYLRRDQRSLVNYEGANDNAASVAAAQEIARAAHSMGGLDADLLFLITSAEEEGLKGAEAFVKAPPVPLEHISGIVNSEMIGFDEHMLYGGRNRQETTQNPLYARTERVAREHGYRVTDGLARDENEGWWGRSDHLPFALRGVPSVVIFGKPPNGQYHTEDDRIENSDGARVRDGARLMFHTLVDLDQDPNASEHLTRASHSAPGSFPGRVWAGNERPPGGSREDE